LHLSCPVNAALINRSNAVKPPLQTPPQLQQPKDPFLEGLKGYLGARAFNTSTYTDLWAALGEATGQPIAVRAGGRPGMPQTAQTPAVLVRSGPLRAPWQERGANAINATPRTG
jgi:hypothetical protein